MKLNKFSRFVTYISCIFFTILLPTLSFAQEAAPGAIDLTAANTDLSIQFLSNIFGTVDGVLHSSGSQIFGAMFGVFNAAVLTLGMTILGYTLFVATLKTAHEGEALGKEWSSIWIPLRSAAGFALMLPKASGYSIIQIGVMFVVVQGVGAANLVWGAALDYLAAGGSIVQPEQPPQTGGVKMVGDILKSEVCMSMLEQALQEENKAEQETSSTTSIVPSFISSVTNPTLKSQPDFDLVKGKYTLSFPGKLFNSDGTEYKKFQGACGSISFTSMAELDNPASKQLADAKILAVTQAIISLNPYAQQLASDYGPFPNAKQAALKTTLKGQDVLVNASKDYQAIIAPAINSMKNNRSTGLIDFSKKAKEEGWIMAGSYYQQLISLNKNYSVDASSYPTTTFKYPIDESIPVPKIITTDTSLTPFFTGTGDNTLPNYIKQQIDQATAIASTAEKTSDTLKYFAGESENTGTGWASNLQAMINPLGTVIAAFVQLMDQKGNLGSNPVSPVTGAAILGSGLINFVVFTWIMGAVSMFGITILTSICPAANPMAPAIQVVTAWFVPLLTVMLVLMFTMGATLAYYIPLIPYILFLFGGIGWIIGVLESIAAAPLVALGIAYPEEHQVLGKAQPAVMLLANIFIRPSLMVIGFIAGISLSYVAVWLLNRGFQNALTAVKPGTLGWAWVFMPISILSIYTVLIVEIINRAFSLIHVLPDEVLRWVGGGHRQMGQETGKAEEAVRGGASSDMKAGGQAIGQSAGDTQKQKGLNEKERLEAEQGKDSGDSGTGVQQ